MSANPKTLVIICGPPSVGKMSVGHQLSRLTGIPLFHNHLSIEAVLPVFAFGSEPFNRVVGRFRDHMFEEAAAGDLPGLIFTYVWAFDQPSDLRFVEKLVGVFESQGGRAIFVELAADLETRLARNRTEERLTAKPSKRDVEASSARLIEAGRRFQLNSAGDFPFPHRHFRIDNTDVSAVDAAERIATHFDLSRVLKQA